MPQKNVGPNKFDTENFLLPKNFVPKIYCSQNIWFQKNVGPKKIKIKSNKTKLTETKSKHKVPNNFGHEKMLIILFHQLTFLVEKNS